MQSKPINIKNIVFGFMILITFVYGPSVENSEYIRNILFSNNEFGNDIVKFIQLFLVVYVIGFNYFDVNEKDRFSKSNFLSVIMVQFLLYSFLYVQKNIKKDTYEYLDINDNNDNNDNNDKIIKKFKSDVGMLLKTLNPTTDAKMIQKIKLVQDYNDKNKKYVDFMKNFKFDMSNITWTIMNLLNGYKI